MTGASEDRSNKAFSPPSAQPLSPRVVHSSVLNSLNHVWFLSTETQPLYPRSQVTENFRMLSPNTGHSSWCRKEKCCPKNCATNWSFATKCLKDNLRFSSTLGRLPVFTNKNTRHPVKIWFQANKNSSVKYKYIYAMFGTWNYWKIVIYLKFKNLARNSVFYLATLNKEQGKSVFCLDFLASNYFSREHQAGLLFKENLVSNLTKPRFLCKIIDLVLKHIIFAHVYLCVICSSKYSVSLKA